MTWHCKNTHTLVSKVLAVGYGLLSTATLHASDVLLEFLILLIVY